MARLDKNKMYNELTAVLLHTKELEEEYLHQLCEYFKPKHKIESRLKIAVSILNRPTKKLWRHYSTVAKVVDGQLTVSDGVIAISVPTDLEDGFYSKKIEKLEGKDEPFGYPIVESIFERVRGKDDPVCKIPIVAGMEGTTTLVDGVTVSNKVINTLNKLNIDTVSIDHQFGSGRGVIYVLQRDIQLIAICCTLPD